LNLYAGKVMHMRLKPQAHRFSYRVFSILIDIDRLAEADQQSRLFSVDRFNLAGFDASDHGPRDGTPLRPYIDKLLAEAGLLEKASRVVLLCYPRILGYVFNPLSVYYAYDAADRLIALVYEVRNTFGEHHSYVAPVRDGEIDVAGVKQERDKLFYVSPFMPMQQRYLFRMRPPGEDIALRILVRDEAGPVLSAAFHGKRIHVTAAALLRQILRIPLLFVQVLGGIHWEALKLWMKGIRLVERPAPPPPVSFNDPSR
jgi:uncharacterized protein